MTIIQDLQAQADKAVAAIQKDSDVENSIIQLVLAQTAQISSLKQQLADAIASGDPAALQAVLASMATAETNALANAQKVADAVTANTPSA